MKLSKSETGKSYRVLDINLSEKVKRRFEILGMTYGCRLSVLNKNRHGAFIIKVRGTRFAVGKEFAEGISLGEENVL